MKVRKTMSKVTCGKCGSFLGDDTDEGYVQPPACPCCGSTKFKYTLFLSDSINFHENLKGKTDKMPKKPGETGKKKPAYEFQSGEERSIRLKKWVKKDRVIDRENDQYYERVVDPDTNEVIHECEELLSQHYGHGSDKKK